MLDLFTVLTSGGIVLFQSPASTFHPPTYLLDSLISEMFLTQRSSTDYTKDGYTVKWTFANDLGLIFVAVYQKILALQWVEELLVQARGVFVRVLGRRVKEGDVQGLIDEVEKPDSGFTRWFHARVKEFEGTKVSILRTRVDIDCAGDISQGIGATVTFADVGY
jgi:signal recognition particle receptor subunit alpha